VRQQTAEELNSDLTIGVDVHNTFLLRANEDIAIQGMNPLGLGFRLTAEDLNSMGIDPRHHPAI
jgi:hypothetical protein